MTSRLNPRSTNWPFRNRWITFRLPFFFLLLSISKYAGKLPFIELLAYVTLVTLIVNCCFFLSMIGRWSRCACSSTSCGSFSKICTVFSAWNIESPSTSRHYTVDVREFNNGFWTATAFSHLLSEMWERRESNHITTNIVVDGAAPSVLMILLLYICTALLSALCASRLDCQPHYFQCSSKLPISFHFISFSIFFSLLSFAYFMRTVSVFIFTIYNGSMSFSF